MTTYIEILDSEIDPESPFTESLAFRYRDNILAIIEGDPSAPSVNPAAIEIGGKGTDGDWENATIISANGYADFSGMEITAPYSLPPCTIIRVKAGLAADGEEAILSSTITVSCLSRTVTTNAAQLVEIRDFLGGFSGNDGIGAGGTGGGGGSVGAGGTIAGGIGGAAKTPAAMGRAWATRRPFVGGNGGLTSGGGAGLEWGPGGGCLILIIEGDLDATGGTIDVDGGHTNDDGGGSNQPGGGGGGSLLVFVTGNLHNGTFRARGGNANSAPGGAGVGGGGGGGWVSLVAGSYTGAQTLTVTGGTSGSAAGGAGLATQATELRDTIRSFLQRL